MPILIQTIRTLKDYWFVVVQTCLFTFLSFAPFANTQALAEETGVSNTTIRVASILDLVSDSSELGIGMKAGIEAALKGEKIQGRAIEYVAVNDSYAPEITIKETKRLMDLGIFAFLGNVGTPQAKAVLPLLASNKVPAVGFYTGSELLRPGIGDIVNFRASYFQEVTSVIEAALATGIKPQQICAYVQNDDFGMTGVLSIKNILQKNPGTSEIVKKLEQIATIPGEEPARNDIGPVGVYLRNTLAGREGYNSLKNWEKKSGTPCRLVVTVGTPLPIANFIGYSRYKGENWIFSMVSATITHNFREALRAQKMNSGLIATSVVPPLDSALPIAEEARKNLQDQLNNASLEGFIVGKMFLAIMRNIKGDITHSNFLKAFKGQTFDIGGLKLDFSNDNQGSDFIQITSFNGEEFKPVSSQQFATVFK